MLTLGGPKGHDFGKSMRKYQDAKKLWKDAKRRGLYGAQGEYRRAMELAELEMIAYGAPGVWCAGVFPWSKAAKAIKQGKLTPKMKDARDRLAKAGRWPLR